MTEKLNTKRQYGMCRPCSLLIAIVITLGSVMTIGAHGQCIADIREVDILRNGSGVEEHVKITRVYTRNCRVELDAVRKDVTHQKVQSWRMSRYDLLQFLSSVGLDGALPNARDYEKGVSAATNSTDSLWVSSIEYDVSRDTLQGKWWASYVSEKNTNNTDCVFILRVPHGEQVASKCGGEWKATQHGHSSGFSIYKWRKTLGQPKECGEAFWLVVGSPSSWQEIGEHLRTLSKPSDYDASRADFASDGLVAQESKGEYKSISALTESFEAYRREQPNQGFIPKSINRTLAEKVGTCKDMSAVLLQALERRGLTSWIVYRASALNDLGECIPCPQLFDHVLVAVAVGKGIWLLDPYAGKNTFCSDMSLSNQIVTIKNYLFVPWCSGTRLSEAQVVSVIPKKEFGL